MDIGKLYGSYTPSAAGQTAAKRSQGTGSFRDSLTSEELTARGGSGETEKEACDVMELVLDSNSSFYEEMYTRMQLQLEQSEEEKKKQAIIDALDAILQSLSAKKDDWRKKPDSVSSMAELSKTIDSLDRFDPRKEQLNLLRERLQNLGIYMDLDAGVKDKDKTGETLTQSLIREDAEKSEPSIFDTI